MLTTASLTILSLIASVALAISGLGSPPAVAHVAFAVGIVPLIFAAMIHFVPVLTRTGDPAAGIRRLPPLAQATGVIVPAALQGWLPYWALYAAAAVDGIFSLILLLWIAGRARRTLGSPHPGWRWYAGALGCLLLALLAVLAMPLFPDYWGALRRFHVHANTLGLVGLAAFGTLPVLLPTALGQPDAEAAAWLKRRLGPMLAGVVLVALGAAFSWPLAIAGSAVLLIVIGGLVVQWIRRFGFPRLLADGVTASLLAAVAGFVLLLAAGGLHGAGASSARPAIFAWAAGFLLPLVTGALSQLLPVWRWPGPAIPARQAMRERLAATGRLRGTLFVAASASLLAGWDVPGSAAGALAIALFAAGLVQAVRIRASTR